MRDVKIMLQEDPLIKRLKELTAISNPTEEQALELLKIKQELELTDEREQEEPLPVIQQHRKKQLQNREKEEQLKILEEERRELELKVKLRRERERIQKAKEALYGKKGQVYCDDCRKWVWPDHFKD